MVWERNDRGTDAQDHRRVDLKVSVLIVLRLPVVVNVLDEHGNHSRFFLLNIQELNQSVLEELLEVPFSGHDLADVLLAVLVEFISHREIIVRVDGSIPGRQVPDMTIRRQHLEIRSKVAVDGCGFRRRFYDEKFYGPILRILS